MGAILNDKTTEGILCSVNRQRGNDPNLYASLMELLPRVIFVNGSMEKDNKAMGLPDV